MKRVLITGAYGFLGRHAVQELGSRGWEVIRIARSPVDGSELALDLEDPLLLQKLRAIDRCDAVVHLASRIDWSPDITQSLYRTNVHGTSCLVILAQDWGARLVFTSSATVCGTRTALINAQSPAVPDTAYGKTKWLAEQLLGTAGIPSAILRFGGIFGAGGPSHLGLNKAIAGALLGEAPTVVGTGAARRNYIYVKDAARAVALALDREIPGTHLLGGSETLTIAQWLDAVCRALLPDNRPGTAAGQETGDQIVVSSGAFPPTRSVAEAMADVRRTYS